MKTSRGYTGHVAGLGLSTTIAWSRSALPGPTLHLGAHAQFALPSYSAPHILAPACIPSGAADLSAAGPSALSLNTGQPTNRALAAAISPQAPRDPQQGVDHHGSSKFVP